MAAAIGVRGRFELLPRSGPGWLLSLSALLSVVARGALATTHWVVTEDGKIQQQVAARVPPLCPRPIRGNPGAGPLGGSARPRPQLGFPRSRPTGRGFLRSDLAPPPPLWSPRPGSAVGNFSAFHLGAARRPGTDPGELRLELPG
uniref:Uncharacterized protein n=1 Tax=Mus musculus TaxID=10090 RepID=Q8C229_MOUSE|nr:unnamed protein product [Mus musculus]